MAGPPATARLTAIGLQPTDLPADWTPTAHDPDPDGAAESAELAQCVGGRDNYPDQTGDSSSPDYSLDTASISSGATSYRSQADVAADVAIINKKIYDVLKPGGLYVILDHAAKDGSGLAATDTLHRIDEAVVIKEVEAAGFKLVGESKVLRNPKDPRDKLVFDPAIRHHTDQFILKFMKPRH